MIVLIATVVLKNFDMIRTTETIGGSHVIIQVIASTARDMGSSAMSMGQTHNRIFAWVSQTSQTYMLS